MGFERLDNPDMVEDLGFEFIDHLTNNVYQGTMKEVSDFYKNVFGFTEIKYFDIRGAKTGLTSYAFNHQIRVSVFPLTKGQKKNHKLMNI